MHLAEGCGCCVCALFSYVARIHESLLHCCCQLPRGTSTAAAAAYTQQLGAVRCCYLLTTAVPAAADPCLASTAAACRVLLWVPR
jgi:hypothetical protein